MTSLLQHVAKRWGHDLVAGRSDHPGMRLYTCKNCGTRFIEGFTIEPQVWQLRKGSSVICDFNWKREGTALPYAADCSKLLHCKDVIIQDIMSTTYRTIL